MHIHHLPGASMTRQELDESFMKYQLVLINLARRKCQFPDEAEDLVQQAYLVAIQRTEYMNVPRTMARNWWCYQVRSEIQSLLKKMNKETQAYERFAIDPTELREYMKDVSEEEAQGIIEGYWRHLTSVQQSRIRKRWKKEGIDWLPFMQPKPPGFVTRS
jgi:DNA-directed RNA polymerase specialized sigma24 family protein